MTETAAKRTNQITEGVIWKQLLLFFFPILLGTFFQQLYNTTDAIVVGNFVGTKALAAVGGPAATIINLLVGFFVGLSSGAAVVISQFYGCGEREKLRDSVHTAMALSIAGGALVMVLGIAMTVWSLRILGTPEEIMTDSIVYMKIYFLGMIPSMIYNMGAGILRAVGDSKRPLYFLIASCGINTVLDLFFVAVLGMGVMGAAVATSLSQVVSATMTLFVLLRTKEGYRVEPGAIRFHKKLLGSILEIGLPAGLQSAMYSISNLVIQAAINDYGTNTIAAWTAYGKVDSCFWMIMSAFGVAVTTFAGQNYGAGKIDRVKQSVRVTVGMSMLTSLLFTFFVMTKGEVFLHFFTQDEAVIRICMDEMVRIVAPAYITYVCIEILSGACRGCGDSLIPMLLTCVGVCVMRILWIFIATRIHPGVETIVFSYPLTWSLTSILFIIYYRRGKWLKAWR